MTTTRFDPPADAEVYAECRTCDHVSPTEADAGAHMHDTFEAAKAEGGSRGHSMAIITPNRERRIQREVDGIFESCFLSEAIDEVQALVDADDITEAEAAHAIAFVVTPDMAWANR